MLEEAGLKYDEQGRERTLYSLRHTALMLRLLKGDKIDIFTLAHNALTSVDQLERFYLSHAESRMKIEALQSSFAPEYEVTGRGLRLLQSIQSDGDEKRSPSK